MPMLSLLLFGTLQTGLAAPSSNASDDNVRYIGPTRTEVDVLRAIEGGPRIYVQAKLPDGELGLFLVDTGADISVLSRATAERLGLRIQEDYGAVSGLGGIVSMDRAVLPTLQLGDAVVPDIELGVGVPGLSDTIGAMPLDGLLGNNVWSRFLLEIDYPADLMVLHAPGSRKLTRKSGPMFFNGSHVFAPLGIETPSDPGVVHTVVLRVDTGAGELSLCGNAATVVGRDFTEGLEPIRGIGASETLPPFRYLQQTRRIPLEAVTLGGKRVTSALTARWMDFDGTRSCPDEMRGLAGHVLLDGHRVFFDYQNNRMQLGKSRRKARQLNGHRVLLDQDLAQYGDDPARDLARARYWIQLDELGKAEKALERHLSANGDEQIIARVLLANLYRHRSDLEGAWTVLEPLGAGDLVDHGEIVAAVNGLLFEDKDAAALSLAEQATDERPEEGWAWIALADAMLWTGDTEGAHTALLKAVSTEQYPDAHLLRRARVALASGDKHASLAHVRKLLQLYPMGGEFLWFYALLADSEATRATFVTDLEDAMGRLHPVSRPIDFLVAANEVTGRHETAVGLMDEGIERDCKNIDSGPAADNCLAWYWSLARVRPDESLDLIQRALKAEGDRSDFLDTKAMVHLARGEFGEAYDAALAAARLSPDNVYMLWQAERIGDLAKESN